MGVQDPLCNAAPTEISGTGDHIPQGVPKWSSLNQSVQELRNKGAIEPAPLTPGFYSRLFLATKATGEWRPIIDLSSLNVFMHCPSFTMETPRSILGALQQGQWLTSLDLKDAYFHIGINPADRRYLRFCRTAWQIHSAAIWVVNQSESIYQNTQTGTSICPSPSCKIAHVFRRLVVKPRDTPGSSRANILAQVPVGLVFKPREIGSNPISENAKVTLMSDNTSAVAYLRNQGGTKSLLMSNLATDIRLWAEKRGMTLVPRHLSGQLNVLADHLSRRGQFLKTEWGLNQTITDRIFHAWGRPFVDLFTLRIHTKLATYISPIREEMSWKVDSLVQN